MLIKTVGRNQGEFGLSFRWQIFNGKPSMIDPLGCIRGWKASLLVGPYSLIWFKGERAEV